jgi:hypothetical protein
MAARIHGRLGSRGMLGRGPALAAQGKYTSTGLPAPDFIIPEPAVNGIVIGAGLILGLLGYNARQAPLGFFLISVGGGLGALGSAYFIRSLLSKPAKTGKK